MPKQPLTPTETEVFGLASEGLTVAAIAEHRSVTENSVYNHLSKIRAKGHEIPNPDKRQEQGEDGPTSSTNGAGAAIDTNGEDNDFLQMAATPAIQAATQMINALREREERLLEEIEDSEHVIEDSIAKRDALVERLGGIRDQVRSASEVGEQLKELVG